MLGDASLLHEAVQIHIPQLALRGAHVLGAARKLREETERIVAKLGEWRSLAHRTSAPVGSKLQHFVPA